MTTHETTIDGHTAQCGCGWTHTTSDLATLQTAALAHEYDAPQYEAAGIDPHDTVTVDLVPDSPPWDQYRELDNVDNGIAPRGTDVDTATPPPTRDGGALPTERTLNASQKAERADPEIVAGRLARVAARLARRQAEVDTLTQERDRHIRTLRAAGWSLRRIGELGGVAFQRVDQITRDQRQ